MKHTAHFSFWPTRVPKTLTVPKTNIFDNLAVSAKRFPQKNAIYYYGATYSYQQILEEAERIAGFLEKRLHVQKGDRVMLYMQNSPQFIISYYAISRINAIVVPINPMNTTEELRFYIQDAQIKTGIVSQEIYDYVAPLLEQTPLEQLVIACYHDYLPEEVDDPIPPVVAESRRLFSKQNHYLWKDVLEAGEKPECTLGNADDLAVMPYTSGTTGLPKGCLHKHISVQANTISGAYWDILTPNSVCFTTLPLFHVTGMIHSMHMPIFVGAEMIVLTRWDREYARKIIKKKQISHWVVISTMLIDFLANPLLKKEDVASLELIAGGGASLPAAVGEKLYKLTGLRYVEGYGLSETISHTHFNPPDRPKLQCLGVPSFDVDARIINPQTLEELDDGQEGEIVVHGPQVFVGYYNRTEDNEKSFLEIDGKKFFRTGDIGVRDEEGYYFIVDRLKRMINASGFKVWPTEVESYLYKHPAVQQACVVGIPDPKRGENVKAFIVLNEEYKGKMTEEELIRWSKEHMAAYKYPRFIEFRDSLPTTSSGKLLWRKLAEEEKKKFEMNK
ncbi:long-chain fatty acid--CoA ligase [Bacillus smithii]|uniref:long-chain fatty acid--CoA ligase n=1 Tax=Bacillus smithii TaxID=1479 RepID=UPI0030C8DD77